MYVTAVTMYCYNKLNKIKNNLAMRHEKLLYTYVTAVCVAIQVKIIKNQSVPIIK